MRPQIHGLVHVWHHQLQHVHFAELAGSDAAALREVQSRGRRPKCACRLHLGSGVLGQDYEKPVMQLRSSVIFPPCRPRRFSPGPSCSTCTGGWRLLPSVASSSVPSGWAARPRSFQRAGGEVESGLSNFGQLATALGLFHCRLPPGSRFLLPGERHRGQCMTPLTQELFVARVLHEAPGLQPISLSEHSSHKHFRMSRETLMQSGYTKVESNIDGNVENLTPLQIRSKVARICVSEARRSDFRDQAIVFGEGAFDKRLGHTRVFFYDPTLLGKVMAHVKVWRFLTARRYTWTEFETRFLIDSFAAGQESFAGPPSNWGVLRTLTRKRRLAEQEAELLATRATLGCSAFPC